MSSPSADPVAEALRERIWDLSKHNLQLQRRVHDLEQMPQTPTQSVGQVDPSRVHGLLTELAAARAELEERGWQVQSLAADVAELDAHLDFARYENEALRTSTSMRVGQALSRLAKPSALRSRPLNSGADPRFRTPPPSRYAERQPARALAGSPDIPQEGSKSPEAGSLADLAQQMRAAVAGSVDAALALALEAKRASLADGRVPQERLRAALIEAESACLVALGRRRRATGRPEDGGATLIDIRCLHDARFMHRGIGRHATTVLDEVISSLPSSRLVGLVGRNTGPRVLDLDPRVSARFDALVQRPSELDRDNVARVICLSPMTAAVDPLAPYLADASVEATAVIFDFIPLDWPARYLHDEIEQIRYYARLLALRQYDAGLAISEATAKRASELFDWHDGRCLVTGVADTMGEPGKAGARSRYLFAPSGADARKNLPVAIDAFAKLTRIPNFKDLSLVISGNHDAGYRERIRQQLSELQLDPHAVTVLNHVPDDELADYFANALVVVVPSLAEGFSLPVAEAVTRGTPVVASDIPEHEELLGNGYWLVPASDSDAYVRALAAVLKEPAPVVEHQALSLGDKAEPAAVRRRIAAGVSTRAQPLRQRRSRGQARPARARIAVLSPMPPQASGVSDYTAFTMRALSERADVTVYTNAVSASTTEKGLKLRPLSAEAFILDEYDLVLSVLGDSAFHIPMLEYLERFGGGALAHDDRMIELYAWWRGLDGAAKIMSSGKDVLTAEDVALAIGHLDEAPSRAFAEIADAADPLVVHSRELARCLENEERIKAVVVPFVPYRRPLAPSTTDARLHTRRQLGISAEPVSIVTFGELDVRTKGVDRIVASLAWLARWDCLAHLHLVGSAEPATLAHVEEQAEALGVGSRLHFHGRVKEHRWQQWLTGADIAVQLRTSGLLTISGALADCIAFGLPSIATDVLANEMEAPAFVHRVPKAASPLQIAEGVMRLVEEAGRGWELERTTYLLERSADRYAEGILGLLSPREASS